MPGFGLQISFEFQEEETDHGNCRQCKDVITGKMYCWHVFVGYEVVGKIRLCEYCYNNPERLDPEYQIMPYKIERCYDVQKIEIPVGAIILGVETDIDENIHLYAYVDVNAGYEEKTIYVSLSGRKLMAPISRFLGTVKAWAGKGILHIYE